LPIQLVLILDVIINFTAIVFEFGVSSNGFYALSVNNSVILSDFVAFLPFLGGGIYGAEKCRESNCLIMFGLMQSADDKFIGNFFHYDLDLKSWSSFGDGSNLFEC
jgi:hypothetical protein